MDLSDKQLIINYLGGDKSSLDILIERYLKYIYNFACKNVGDQSSAEDITQEVFIKVWKNIRKFDQKKNFKPWIFQIAKNTSIDFLRKKRTIPFSRFENEKGQNILAENIVAKPLNLLENFGDKRTLAVVLQGLIDKDQKLINLRHNDGMSFKEIAEKKLPDLNTTDLAQAEKIIAGTARSMGIDVV